MKRKTGWKNEPARHALSAKGVKTGKNEFRKSHPYVVVWTTQNASYHTSKEDAEKGLKFAKKSVIGFKSAKIRKIKTGD